MLQVLNLQVLNRQLIGLCTSLLPTWTGGSTLPDRNLLMWSDKPAASYLLDATYYLQLRFFTEDFLLKIFHLSESSSSRAEPATQWPVRMPKHLRTLNSGDIAAIVHLFRCLGDAPKVALPAFSLPYNCLPAVRRLPCRIVHGIREADCLLSSIFSGV